MAVFERQFFDDLAARLTANLVHTAAPVDRDRISDQAAQLAIRECLFAALLAQMAVLPKMPESDEKSLADCLQAFFCDQETARSLAVLLRGKPADTENLLYLWNRIGVDAQMPDKFDWGEAMSTFESVFGATANRKPALTALFDSDNWRYAGGKSSEYRQQIEQLLDVLSAVDLESLLVNAGRVQVGGDVQGCIIITGDNNHLNVENLGPDGLTGKNRKGGSPQQIAVQQYCQTICRQFANINLFGRLPQVEAEAEDTIERMQDITYGFVPLSLCEWQEGNRAEAVSLDYRQLFTENTSQIRVLIRGLPGSGKSTLLRYLAYHYAAESDIGENQRVPVVVRLKDLDLSRGDLPSIIKRAIDAACRDYPQFEMLCRPGVFLDKRMILLLDGIDEIEEDQTRADFARALDAFATDFPRCQIVVTSRPAALNAGDYRQFRTLELKTLDPETINDYLHKWFSRQEERCRQLQKVFAEKSRVGELAANPFLLSMICYTFDQEGDAALVERRSALYQNCTRILLQRLYDDGESNRPAEAQQREMNNILNLLKEISLRFFLWDEADFPVNYVNTIGGSLGSDIGPHESNNLLYFIERKTGLLLQTGNGFTFVHRSLWEYFTALALMDKPLNYVLRHAANVDWEEVLRLYAGMQPTIEDVRSFLEKLWPLNRPLALRVTTEVDVPAGELVKPLLQAESKQNKLLLIDAIRQFLPLISPPGRRELVRETLQVLLLECQETDCEVIYAAQQFLEEMQMAPLNAGGLIYQLLELDLAEQRQEELLRDADNLFQWIEVEGGSFLMGDDRFEQDEQPVHEVQLSSFLMSKHPVTNQLLAASKFPLGEKYSNYGGEAHPAIGNSWFEAYYFSLWIGAQLPTEAQWEYAARGGNRGSNTAYYFGDNPEELPQHAWFAESREGNVAHPVDEINPRSGKENLNPLGMANMLGNVQEWCADWYSSDYYSKLSDESPVHDPPGPPSGVYRVIRGGSWAINARFCRVSFRNRDDPADRNSVLGFRLLRTP